MDDFYQKIDKYIDSEKENILRDWIELVKIPSVGASRTGEFVFGKEIDNVLEKVTALFNENGFEMKKHTDRGYVIYNEKRNGEKNIGLFAHADVVPVNEQEWTWSKPFEPVIKDGYLIGRGSRDNKGGIMAILYALKALKNAGVKLNSGLTVCIGGNEETGMRDIEAFIENESMPDISLVPDNFYPFSKGERGLINLICKSKAPFHNICDFNGGEAYNSIPDLVNVSLKYDEAFADTVKKSDIDVCIENNIMSFQAKGITGHAASPEGTLNAAHVAAELLLEKARLDENDRNILQCLNNCTSSPYGEVLNIASDDESGRLTATNGFVKLCDGCLQFSLDIRYGVSVDGNDIINKVREYVGKYGFEVEVTKLSPGFVLEDNREIEDVFFNSIKRFGGNAEESAYISKGLTYARRLKNAYSFGTNLVKQPKIDGLKANHGCAHQADEAANIEGLIQGIKIMTAILCQVDGIVSKS